MKALLSRWALDRETTLLVVSFVGVVALGLVIAVGPVRKKFGELDAAIAASEKAAARNLRLLKSASMETVQGEYRIHGGLLAGKGSAEEESAAMLAEIERLAGECKIVMSRTTPQKPRMERDYEEYGVELEVESDLEQMVRFLVALETSVQVLRVDRLTLDSRGARDPATLKGMMLISRIVTR